MAKFQFHDYSLVLEFPLCEFTVMANSDLGDTLNSMHEKFVGLLEEYRAGTKTKQEAIAYVTESINTVLGDGATAKIFGDRKITLSDAADVLIYIANEVTNHSRKYAPTQTNREQRRAAKAK